MTGLPFFPLPAEALEAVYGPAHGPHMQVELVAEKAAPETGSAGQGDSTYWVGVLFDPEEHWHIYWKNPGDSGTPPAIQWKELQGGKAGDIQWPAPHRLSIPPLMDFGYSGRTLLMVPIHGIRAGANELRARVDWLVCREVCVPGRAELKLALPVGSPRPQEFVRTRGLLPKTEPSLGWGFRDLGTELVLELPQSRFWEDPEFFPADSNQIDNPAAQVFEKPAAGQPGLARLKLKKSDQLSVALGALKGLIEYGPPGARQTLEVEAQPVGSSAGQGPWGLLQALFLAFLGGIILNLMPCVFPVLSIKVLAFMSQKDHEIHLQRRHALVYTLGILVSFWGLTAMLLGLRAAGEQIGWGFQLQSPTFVAVLATMLFFLGLSLAGVFEVGGSLLGVGRGLISGEGYTSSFFTGVLATVVATPCTAPMMGSAVGFALSQPLPVVFGVFTALALGLALPYVVLAWFPVFGRWMPRPGRWMETFKQLMAFPIFGTVIWLVWVYGLQTDINGILRLLTGLLLISLGAWTMGRYPSRMAAAGTAVLTVLALWIALARSPESKWEPYSAARVAELRAQHQTVFVDFTAAWCVSCKVNELVALQSSQVMAEFERKKVKLVKGDWTSSDPQITEALRQLGRSGVPFYVLYYTRDGVDETVTLPEALTPQIVLRALEAIP